MKLFILIIISLAVNNLVFAQHIFSGQIINENKQPITLVDVINITNQTKVKSDFNGNFSIEAKSGDELRMVKKGYERSKVIFTKNLLYSQFIQILKPFVIEIEEVDLSKVLTGNLKKDIQQFTDKKADALNINLAIYMKTPMYELIPKATIPKSFQQPKVNMIALDLVDAFSKISELINGKTTPVFVPTDLQYNKFFKDIKNDLGVDYFKSLNIPEQDIDEFLSYSEAKLKLSSRYIKNYNINLLMIELEEIYPSFKNKKNGSSINVKSHIPLAKILDIKFGFGTKNVAT